MTDYEEQVLFLLKKIANTVEVLQFSVENLERKIANPNTLRKNHPTTFKSTRVKDAGNANS
jgi:hypothetical protein